VLNRTKRDLTGRVPKRYVRLYKHYLTVSLVVQLTTLVGHSFASLIRCTIYATTFYYISHDKILEIGYGILFAAKC